MCCYNHNVHYEDLNNLKSFLYLHKQILVNIDQLLDKKTKHLKLSVKHWCIVFLYKGVALRVGKNTSIKTIVLQVHYAKIFKGKLNYLGLKFLFIYSNIKKKLFVFHNVMLHFVINIYHKFYKVKKKLKGLWGQHEK